MKVIDRAKSHFESLGVQHIEVPEWEDEHGQATIIYWNPITLGEKKKIFSKADSAGVMVVNDVGILADIVVMKSLDKDGKKLFLPEDRIAIMHKVDSDVLAKIATAIMKTPTPDDQKKK
jgi:hypothetical protein